MDWAFENTAFISMLTGIASALIWLVYLQVIVTTNGRQRRALISINRGAGKNLDAHLVLCNLGYETVYVTDVVAEVEVGGERMSANVTDLNDEPEGLDASPLSGTLQGPLANSDCRNLGTVRTILERVDAENGLHDRDRATSLTIVVLAGREHSIGVRRRYRLLYHNDLMYLDADMMNTKKMPLRKARRYREKWGYDVPKGYSDEIKQRRKTFPKTEKRSASKTMEAA